MNGAALPVFPNYTQLPSRVPIAAWHALRVLNVAAAVGLAALLVVRPEQALFVLWQLVIPIVPAVFLVAPGLWRNVCPLAALNPETHRYAKLVIAGGRRIAGAVLLGFPKEAPLVTEALKSGRDVSNDLAALRVGDWSVLEPEAEGATA